MKRETKLSVTDQGKAGEEERRSALARLVDLGVDGCTSLAFLLGWRPLGVAQRASVARGGLFFPLFGAAIGALLAGLMDSLEVLGPAVVALLCVLLLAAASGGRFTADLRSVAGISLVVILLAAEWWAFAGLTGNLRSIALILAPMLGRWAYVIQAYGSLPARPAGFAATLVANLQFTQFAVASVSAMAIALVLINALGTIVLLAVASLAIGIRVIVHSRRGGVSGASLGAGAAIAEALTVILVGVAARIAAA